MTRGRRRGQRGVASCRTFVTNIERNQQLMPIPDEVFLAAMAAVRAKYPDAVWNTMTTAQQTKAIYDEMRRLYLASQKSHQTPQELALAGSRAVATTRTSV